MTASGAEWRRAPLRRADPSSRGGDPNRPDAGRGRSPFTRLAWAHAAMAAGDAAIAVALAGSVFFDTDPRAARWRVALFLALTMAPFAVVAPLVGPAIDRVPGGRRLTIALIGAARALVALAMAAHVDTLALFPEALVSLVLSKAYIVSKSALVPSVVTRREQLVEANAKLGLTSGLVGFLAAVPALLLQLAGGWATLLFAALIFAGAAVLALGLPRGVVARGPAEASERAELRSASVVLAATVTALQRGVVGFLTFHIAFWLRTADAAPAWFGLMLVTSALGTMSGNLVGPRVRRRMHEEPLLVAGLVISFAGAALAVVFGDRASAAFAAYTVALAGSLGRAAFDSIVQRDAPEANRGRAFAQFEARFQLVWVAGAFVPVAITIPHRLGFVLIALATAVGSVYYVGGLGHVRERGTLPPPVRVRAQRKLRQRRTEPPEGRGPSAAR